jgi:predicted AlkP superfamily phosphohydrolase/phosphomutase
VNELLSDTRFWLTTMGAALVGLIRYLWKGQEKRLAAVEAEMVRRSEFEQLRDDISAKLDKIETGVTGTHRRMDDLYRDLIPRNGGGR